MRHMGGCTECFTVWWGCRCPLRCEECGAGYRDDGNSNCGTPGCRAGQRRHWAMVDRWASYYEEGATETAKAEPPTTAPAFQCETVELPAEPDAPHPLAEPAPSPRPASPRRAGVQNGQARRPDARSATRPSSSRLLKKSVAWPSWA